MNLRAKCIVLAKYFLSNSKNEQTNENDTGITRTLVNKFITNLREIYNPNSIEPFFTICVAVSAMCLGDVYDFVYHNKINDTTPVLIKDIFTKFNELCDKDINIYTGKEIVKFVEFNKRLSVLSDILLNGNIPENYEPDKSQSLATVYYLKYMTDLKIAILDEQLKLHLIQVLDPYFESNNLGIRIDTIRKTGWTNIFNHIFHHGLMNDFVHQLQSALEPYYETCEKFEIEDDENVVYDPKLIECYMKLKHIHSMIQTI